ncbi:VCBS repeat-containing protein [Vibrio crassostreae]|nr:VCBS repeat-containing protein [Vibrio crassostreae]CAK2306411.1 VCBS repeat-containing protein [Vibrio crassostreae]CAK2422071.1 VCBS repeat-containing protein [Vibrio crassostreae]CAK2683148.1 VCBS repeat-containing protein [Vibrio crassostreae]
MTKENNVKKSTKRNKKEQPKTQSANAVKQKKPKKVRLHSKLKVNVPLTQSLMLILPSLAKHASAETVSPTDDSTLAHQEPINDQKSTVHSSIDVSKDENQKPITRNIHDSDAIVGQESSSTGGETTLRPSHHLSSSSHPQAHYIPASSIPSIESGGITAPTNNVPTTPSLQVTFTPEVIKGIYGELHVDSGGKYTFVLNPLSPQYVLLHQNQPGTDKFVLHLSNGSSIVVQIPVTGKQDVPTISGDLHGIVTEDSNVDSHGLLNAAGKIDVIDPDHDQSSVLAETITGKYGTLTIDSNGAWHYQVDNSLPNIQALTSLTSLHESFTIHTKDGTPQALEMTIGGIDDNAVVTGLDTGTLIEDSTLHAHGQLTVSDLDLNQDHFQSEQLQGHWGSLSIQPDGSWTYDLDNTNPKVQSLSKGSTVTDIITVHSADGTPHQITLTINGTNDAATVSTATIAVDETDTAISTSGTLTSTDVDNPDNAFTPDFIAGTNGNLTIDANGHWVFTANSAFNQLNVSDKVEETFTVSSVDGTASTIKVAINGTNNAATVSSATVAIDETDKVVTTSGTLTSTDIDNPDNIFTPDSISGTNGDLTIDANGHWTFTANSAFNQLNVGDKVEETFTVSSIDGTPSTIKVTINGTNDAATVSSATVAIDETDKAVTTSGTLTSTDVDNPDNTFTPDSISGTNGDLTIDANGHWTFTANSAFNQLNVGDKVEETFTVSSIDGTPSTIKVTIHGTNDAAVISGTDTGDVHEGHTYTAPDGHMTGGSVDDRSPDHMHGNIGKLSNDLIHTEGQLIITDADKGESHVATGTYQGHYGHIIMLPSGEWNYYASIGQNSTGRKIDHLGQGETLTDTVTIKSADGTRHDINITIHGDNDSPYTSSEVVLVNGDEDKAIILTAAQLLQNTVDVDANDRGQLSIENLQANHGAITVNPNGTFTFTPSNDYNGQVHFSYDVKDAHGGVTHTGATTTLVAVNDNPDAQPITDSVTEDTDSHHTVDLLGSAKDVDGDPLSVNHIQVTFEGHTGPLPVGVSIAPDGHTLIIDSHSSAFQHLSAGEKSDITIQYTVADNHGGQTPATATITMIGADDKAQLQSSTIDITEGQALHTFNSLSFINGQIGLVDPDTHDKTAFVHSTSAGNQGYGRLSMWPDGHYTFSLDWARNHYADDKVAALKQNETLTDQYQIQTSDGQTKLITITIHGEDSGARIDVLMPHSLPASQHIYEEHFVPASQTHLYAGGRLKVIDPDHDDAYLQPETIQTAHHGEFRINANGGWNYKIDNSIDEVQHLGAGESFTETHTVHSKDGTASQLLTVTVHGTNDIPTVSAEVKLAPSVEDTDIQLTTSELLSHATDIDHNDIGHLSIANLVADHGSIVDNKDGTFTFQPAKDYNGQVHFSYDVKDAHGGITHTGASTTLANRQDSATFGGTDTGDVHEGHTYTAPDGSMTGGSVDDRSPDHMHGNIGKLWNDEIHTEGHLAIIDADTGESHALNGVYQGSLGRVILQSNGDWSYFASIGQDATGRAIDHLGKGESLTDTVTVKSADGTTHDIVVTIHGDNDSPYCSSEVQLNSGKEDLAQTITSAELLANTIDVDTNDLGKLTIANLHADHGSIQDNQDGTFTFTPTKDYNGQVHFTYDVTDAHGGITATGANLHLQATGDAATITGIDQGNVTEDRGYIDTQYNLHFDGKLDIVDPDQGEAQFDIQRGHTYHGIGYDTKMGGWVLLQQDGTYTYTIDNRKPEIQNLGSTETLVDKVTIHSVDGTSHEIQITIHGTNDDPKVSSVTTLPAGTEDTDVVLHVSDLLANATDIDHNDAGQLSVANLTADHGKITDNHDGTFTFRPALDYNGKVSFSYDVKDAHAGSTATSASMTLAPTSDAAVITGSGSGVKEDINVDISSGHLLGASGVFHVVDPDGPAQSQFPDVLYGGIYQGSHGGDLQVNSNGNYYYHISNYLVQHLSEGEILKEEYTIHSVDGTQHKVEFTVEGTNDKPVLSAQSQSVTEGGTLLSGQMHATDVDTKDTHTFTIDKPVDGLTFNNDGSYTFDPSHASYQNLGANNDQVIHVQVKVDDHNGGTDTKTLTLVVHGTNDGATIGGQDTFTVQEDHDLTLNSGNTIIYNGQLTITDADAGEDHFDGNLHQNQQTGTWDTGYTTQEGGKLILQSNGSYRYEIDNSLAKIQSLGSSETLIDTVTVRSADGTPHQIQVTIEGDNDAPVVSSAVTLTAGTEDTDVVLHISDLLANATDIDHNDAGQLSVTNLTADHGKITDNHDGTFTFHPNQDYNGKVSFTYDVLDKHGGSVATTASITLAPTRDSAVISGNDTGTIIEDHNVGHSSAQKIAISGSLSVTDPDTGEDHFRFNQFGEKAIHDPFGGDLRITPAGSWGYEVSNSRLQSLAEGEVEKVVYRVYSADHTAHDITITVTGTNDQPTITATTLAHGTEDTHYQMQASQFGFTDIDTGDTLHFIAITDLPPATQGKFLLDGHDVTTGQQIPTADISKLQFVPTQDFNGDVQFKYTVNDGHADSLETTNTLRIDPVADAATFTGDSGSLGEDTNIHHNVHTSGSATIPDALVCNGHLVISDVDGQGEATLDLKGQQHISQDGTYGHFIVLASGTWVYSADNSDTRIQDLDNGQILTDSIEVTSKDGTKHSITVTINGTTDDPVLHSLSDSGVQHSGPVEGNLLTGSGTDQGLSGAATDTDSNAHLVLQDIQIKDPVSGYVAVRPGQPHTMAGIGTLAIEANGHYTFTPEAGFTGKVPSMVYRVGDDGGNPTGDSSQNSLSIEVTPPQPNTVSLALATGSDSGSKGDLITNDNTPSVEGHTLIPNSSVDIVENGKVIGTTVSDGNGDYHLDLPGLTDATHTLQAVATEPLSSAQVQSHPMAVVIDTTATVAIEPISTDSMLTGTERSHSFDITGSVTGVDDGQTVQIELEHQTYQGQVSGGKWHVTLPASLASSLQGGVHQVTVSVTDNAGNLATMASPLFVVDGTNTPPLPIMHTPHITGGGGVGSHVTGDLIAPPLLQQLHPQVGSGWGILAPDGHTVTHLQGQYGTLVIDPQTGHVDYQYSSAPTPGQKAAGGTHWAGQTTSDQHHDVFQVMYHDTHSSNVDVKVNLDVTYMHGHSGHNQASTQLVGMSVTPVVPSVQHDEPDSPLTFEASVTIVDDSNGPNEQHVSTTEFQHHDTSHHGAAAYLDALGIKPDATSTAVHDQPADMDIVLAQVDQQDAATHDQAHLDMSDALEHHDANVNHNQDDEHHHHNDIDGLPDIDPNP